MKVKTLSVLAGVGAPLFLTASSDAGFNGVYAAGNPLKRAYNAIMTKGECVIAPSEFVANHIRETYGDQSERMRVILRGIDLEIFNQSAVTAARADPLEGA